jgi:hypothetical protein
MRGSAGAGSPILPEHAVSASAATRHSTWGDGACDMGVPRLDPGVHRISGARRPWQIARAPSILPRSRVDRRPQRAAQRVVRDARWIDGRPRALPDRPRIDALSSARRNLRARAPRAGRLHGVAGRRAPDARREPRAGRSVYRERPRRRRLRHRPLAAPPATATTRTSSIHPGADRGLQQPRRQTATTRSTTTSARRAPAARPRAAARRTELRGRGASSTCVPRAQGVRRDAATASTTTATARPTTTRPASVLRRPARAQRTAMLHRRRGGAPASPVIAAPETCNRDGRRLRRRGRRRAFRSGPS